LLLHKQLDTVKCMREMFEALDESILSSTDFSAELSGSTATIAVCAQGHLTVANAGDSICVLGTASGSSLKALEVTRRHLPSDFEERNRVWPLLDHACMCTRARARTHTHTHTDRHTHTQRERERERERDAQGRLHKRGKARSEI